MITICVLFVLCIALLLALYCIENQPRYPVHLLTTDDLGEAEAKPDLVFFTDLTPGGKSQ